MKRPWVCAFAALAALSACSSDGVTQADVDAVADELAAANEQIETVASALEVAEAEAQGFQAELDETDVDATLRDAREEIAEILAQSEDLQARLERADQGREDAEAEAERLRALLQAANDRVLDLQGGPEQREADSAREAAVELLSIYEAKHNGLTQDPTQAGFLDLLDAHSYPAGEWTMNALDCAASTLRGLGMVEFVLGVETPSWQVPESGQPGGGSVPGVGTYAVEITDRRGETRESHLFVVDDRVLFFPVPCDAPTESTPAPEATSTPTPVPTATPAPAPPAPTSTPAPAPAAPSQTVSQQNAIESARSYLRFTNFSRQGLIGQLEFEGFPTADATYAVDNITVDWNAQAAGSAQSYLDFTSFSCSGLVDQLVFEGFTQAQAQFGASAVRLC
ncbi:MAG: Ltp family lipoprotein [Actinomycetota bacterium]